MTKEEIIKEDNENVAYAGFWSRYAALLIDIIIMRIVIIPLVFGIAFFLVSLNLVEQNNEYIGMFIILLFSFIAFIFYFVFMTYKFQATLGKMAVGIVVKGEDGKKLSLKKIIIREVFKIVQLIVFSFLFVLVVFTGKKQGLHDLAVKSVVICKNPQKGVNKWVVGSVLVLAVLFILVMISSN